MLVLPVLPVGAKKTKHQHKEKPDSRLHCSTTFHDPQHSWYFKYKTAKRKKFPAKKG